MSEQKNVLNQPIRYCKTPSTGFKINGYCDYYREDVGNHTVCAKVTDAFLEFTKSRGNNLHSAGIKEGDFWCLCVSRWLEAYRYDPKIAPKIDLQRTNEVVLDYIPLNILIKYKL